VEPTDRVNNLINCLTSDEDIRQELWVHYLSGNPIDSFSKHLQKIQVEYTEDEKLKTAIWDLINNPLSEKLQNILNNFTDFEQGVICLLMLGLTVENISSIKGISQVRIRQSISSIRYNTCWREKYGTENKVIGRRAIRS
jgi:DNA-directed RNA polymerase specialized sigma subunit